MDHEKLENNTMLECNFERRGMEPKTYWEDFHDIKWDQNAFVFLP